MQSISELWAAVQEKIKAASSEIIYEVWLKDLKLVTFDGISAEIETDGFRIKIIEQKFTETIRAAFEEVTGLDVEISVVEASEPEVKPFAASRIAVDRDDEESTFDNFVVGPSNRFTHAAAVSVAEKPGVSGDYNPLFIYGNSGLGKTHLLHAICHEIEKRFPEYKVVYTRGEAFTNEVIEGIKEQRMKEIRAQYRNADVLLMDDIQFIAGKESTQEEFFHTFDELIREHKQIVVTSDRPPKDMKILDERIKSRFETSLLTDIQPPDLETRIAIIQRKAQMLDFEIPVAVVNFIAESITNNVRQLEGAVKKLKALVTINGVDVNIRTAQIAIKDILSSGVPAPITVEKIVNEVARCYGVEPDDIRSEKKDARIAAARHMAVFITKELTNLSSTAIGREFGDRDHATILNSIKVMRRRLETDSAIQEIVEDIKKNVSE